MDKNTYSTPLFLSFTSMEVCTLAHTPFIFCSKNKGNIHQPVSLPVTQKEKTTSRRAGKQKDNLKKMLCRWRPLTISLSSSFLDKSLQLLFKAQTRCTGSATSSVWHIQTWPDQKICCTAQSEKVSREQASTPGERSTCQRVFTLYMTGETILLFVTSSSMTNLAVAQ